MYPSDIKEKQWALIKHLLEKKSKVGSPCTHSRRTILNAIFYIAKTGCQWRMLPNDFPPFTTVYGYYKQWCEGGVWEKILDILNEKDRIKMGRNPHPSFGIIDSQSTKTQYHSHERGIDGGKKGEGS
jgi:putative transposase